MKILVIPGNNYPTSQEPEKGVFVYKLIQEFVDQGNEVIVFAPKKIRLINRKSKKKYGSEKAKIIRPSYLSLSNLDLRAFNTYHVGKNNQIRILRRLNKKGMFDKIDIVYSHFISNALIAIPALGQHKPVYAAVGEYKDIDVLKQYYKVKTYNNLIQRIKGFIAVSPQVKQKLIQIGIEEEKIIMLPNAVDSSKFKPSDDKTLVRKKLGLPNKKLVLFVGRFVHEKGPLRLIEAVEKSNFDIGLIFLGAGPKKLKSSKIIFQGAVPNTEVAQYMAASDLFVLPTLDEGSNNSIVEAMATGMPIVSSDIPEIRVQCAPEFSILIDPMDTAQITKAIDSIIGDETRLTQMSEAAVIHSKKFCLKERAQNIIEFFKTES